MMAFGWLDRALIPNTDGYRLMLLLHDGRRLVTSVRRGDDGIHRLDGMPIVQVAGWMRA